MGKLRHRALLRFQARPADAELAAKADTAAGELDQARRSALAEIEALAVELTQEIVAKVAGGKVTEAKARKAVAEALNHG